MVSKAQKIRLGIFLITGITFLIVLLVLIAGTKLMEKRDTFFVIYDDVSVNGLQVGGQVMYHGIRIGRVDDIRIQKNDVTKVIVELSVKKDTPIKEDIEATLVSVGITGLKQVELTGGTNKAKTLKPRSFIKPGKSLLDNITDKAEAIANKVEIVLENIIGLTNKENQDKFSSILTNVDDIINNTRGPIMSSFTNIDSLTYQLALTTVKANKLVDRINSIVQNDKIDKIITNSEIITKNISEFNTKKIETDLEQTTKNLNEAVSKANILISKIDGLVQKSTPEITATIETLRETVDNLNEFSRLISEDPSILIKSRRQTVNP